MAHESLHLHPDLRPWRPLGRQVNPSGSRLPLLPHNARARKKILAHQDLQRPGAQRGKKSSSIFK